MIQKVLKYFRRVEVTLAVYVVIGLITSLQHYLGGPSRYNNFIIFRQGFFHLLDHKNLHIEYPAEYYDLFLYHPSFCVLFSPFSLLPLPLSLVLWTLTCSLILFYAIKSLPLSQGNNSFFWWFMLIELITSLHSQQTNPVIAALGLFTYTFLEKGKLKWAALFPLLAFCIKGYGLVFAALFLFYPKKGQYMVYSVLWLLLLSLLPLPFVGKDYFIQIYQDWYHCLIDDHSVNFGFSIMGLCKLVWPALTDRDVTKIQLAGAGLFGLTWILGLFNGTITCQRRRMLLLAYTCLWVIMFNHASESPTYVIAIAGVSIFYIVNKYFHRPKSLIVLVLFFSMLAPTDIYPPSWRKEFFEPYLIKVIPCFLVWLALQLQLLFSYEHIPINLQAED